MSAVIDIPTFESHAPSRGPTPGVRLGSLRAFGRCGIAFALLSAVAWVAAQLVAAPPGIPAWFAGAPGGVAVHVLDVLALRYLLLIPLAIGLHRILPPAPGGAAGALLLALSGVIGAAGIPSLAAMATALALAAFAGRLSHTHLWRQPAAYTGATAALAVAATVTAVLLGGSESAWANWFSTLIAGQWVLVMGLVLTRVSAQPSAPRTPCA